MLDKFFLLCYNISVKRKEIKNYETTMVQMDLERWYGYNLQGLR